MDVNTRLDAMAEALRGIDATYAELRLESRESLGVGLASGAVTSCRRTREQGGIARALVRGAWGVSVFDGCEDLSARVREAVDAARAVAATLHDDDRVMLAGVDPVRDHIDPVLVEDARAVPLDAKLEVLRAAEAGIRERDPGVARTVVTYADQSREVWLATSEGTRLYERRPLVDMALGAYVRQEGLDLRASAALSLPAGFEACRDRRDLLTTLTERTRGLRHAIAPPSAKLPVVMDPVMSGLFAHEAFGHLSEADNTFRDPGMREVMRLGRRFGSGILTIGDDGSLPGLRATHRYDDEGVPTRRNYLLREGELVGRMHSRETAGRLGEALTGNAWAVSHRFAPLVRMTNTFIEPGTSTFEEMIADIPLGLYACGHFGGSTTREQFVFNGSHGWMIRDGRLAEMVRNVTLSGNVFQTLHDIDAVGSDPSWYQLGYCGKAGQSGHPTSKGTPHVRVRELVIGGR
jgi:TldD protein